MRPLRLRARNFIGLREVDISFENRGLFVIQGPNGAGKSSILEAIYFALFGKTIRHDRGYEGVVNKLSSENKALVELEFLHHGKRWRIKREVDIRKGERVSSVFLECLDTTEKAISKRDASDKVKRLLGLTDDTFRATVLLPQGEITAFLELSETDRMKVLKELLGGSRLSLIADHVDADLRGKEGELNSYSVQLGMIDPQKLREEREKTLLQVKELEAKINDIDQEIAVLDGRLAELREKESLLRELLKSREFKVSLEKKRERAFTRISEIDLEVERRKMREEELQTLLSGLEEGYEREREVFEQIEEIWSRALPLRSEISSLERESKEKTAKMGDLLRDIERLRLEIGEERLLRDKLRLEEENLKREYEEKREKYFIYELRRGLRVGEACPLCGAIVKSLDSLVEKVEVKELSYLKKAHDDALKRLQDKEKMLSAREKDLENKERMKLELASELELLKERLREKEIELGKLIRVLKDKFGDDNLEGVRAKQKARVEALREAREKAQRELSAVRASLLSLLDEKVRLEGEVREIDREIFPLNSKIVELESKIGVEVPLEALLREIGLAEESLRRLRSERDSIRQDLLIKKSRIESIDKDIKNYSWLKSKVEELEVEVSLLRELKRTLGDSRFPKFLVSHYLIEASRIANFYLSRLTRERYSIEATEDLKIFVLDSEIGGERRNIRDLSGGERVLVSLSLALGIAEVLAGGLEAFFIDEGFSPLDKENLDMVAHELLELDNSGKLVGIITHDPVFADYFPAKLLVRDGMAQWA